MENSKNIELRECNNIKKSVKSMASFDVLSPALIPSPKIPHNPFAFPFSPSVLGKVIVEILFQRNKVQP